MPYDPNVITDLTNPLGDANVPSLIGTTINYVLSVVGSIALAIIVYAGFKWMNAKGAAEEAKSAGQMMLWAGLGLAVIFFSYLILDYVIKAVK